MIQAKELRIGNIVYNNLGTRHEPVHTYLLLDSLNYDMRLLDPIPLTEDMLLKCGFVVIANYHPEGKTYQFDDFTITEHYKYLSYKGQRLGNKYVQSLHTLQNIYYCITGEELNVEL